MESKRINKRFYNKEHPVTLKRVHMMNFLVSTAICLLYFITCCHKCFGLGSENHVNVITMILFAIMGFVSIKKMGMGIDDRDLEDELAVENLHKAERYMLITLMVIAILISFAFVFFDLHVMVDSDIFTAFIVIIWWGGHSLRSCYFLLIERKYGKESDESED